MVAEWLTNHGDLNVRHNDNASLRIQARFHTVNHENQLEGDAKCRHKASNQRQESEFKQNSRAEFRNSNSLLGKHACLQRAEGLFFGLGRHPVQPETRERILLFIGCLLASRGQSCS